MFDSTSFPLSHWALVKVAGDDRVSFLQGQFTSNLNELEPNRVQFSAHCDPKGKLIAPLILFCTEEAIYYVLRQSTLDVQLAALKKYAIFSKVVIEAVSNCPFFGLLDCNPPLSAAKETFYLELTDQIAFKIQLNAEQMHSTEDSPFELALIKAGFPLVDLPLSGAYLPQAFNLEAFQAINYKKGCYCGQEMVARAHYRGANKRALYLYQGTLMTADFSNLPLVGAPVFQTIGAHQRETGSICAVIKDENNGNLWVQLILPSDFDVQQEIRLTPQSQPLEFVRAFMA